jgi:hypothetical protein
MLAQSKTIFSAKLIIIILLIGLSANFAWAEKIKLKSGEVIKATVVGEAEDYIEIYYYDSILTYYKNEIEKIEPEIYPPSDYPALPPEEDVDLIYKIRSKYYAPGEQGLRGFSCRLNSSMVDKVKDMVNLEISIDESGSYNFDDLELFINFGIPSEVKLTTEPPDFLSAVSQLDSIDKRVSDAIRYTRWSAVGFAQGWSFFMLSTTASLMGREHRTVKTDNGYMISYGDLKGFVDNNLAFTKIYFRKPNARTVFFPEFTDSSEGLLFSGYFISVKSRDGYLNVRGDIEYNTVEGFFLPKKIKLRRLEGGETLEIDFSDYKLNLE